MNVKILPSAIEDLASGFDFYEVQQTGLGSYFLESLFSDIESLRLYAGIHPKVFGFHRSLSKRFPYAIYYSTESETANVRAVLDCRRNPDWVQKRLKSS
jgi:hypothetical protein